MGFERYIKRRGTPSGDAVTFNPSGGIILSHIENIEKYHSIEVYVDKENALIALVFSEKQRLKFENDTFAIFKNKDSKTYSANIEPVYKDMNIKLDKKVILPFELVNNKMYVFDFSKYRKS